MPASLSPLHSLRYHLQISKLLEPPLRVQTDENQKIQGLDCMVGVRELQILVPEGFPRYGLQNYGRCYFTIKEHSETIFISGFCKLLAPVRLAACHNSLHTLLWFPFLNKVQG
jgi:hypothetical protein